MEKIRVGISRCLTGDKIRYDGTGKQDHYLTDTLGRSIEWCPVCPEVECGLPVPREAMQLVEESDALHLRTTHTGIDHTERMVEWSRARLDGISHEGLSGFIFKSRSPSCALGGVHIETGAGTSGRKDAGLFATAFTRRFPLIPAEDEERLRDPGFRENFLIRLFVFKRWQKFIAGKTSAQELIAFHSNHKLLILSHSTKHYTTLGRLIATAGDLRAVIHGEYISLLMEGLRLPTTSRKNTNVLLHIAGYFKKHLSADEKSELLGLIEEYRKGFLPLAVPLTLLRHYVRKYKQPYLETQFYLSPHPTELMLRNHA